MTFEIALVLAVVAGAMILFALEVFTVDFVAFAIMAVLLALGLVTPQEGISGFSNPATITVLAMFIISAGVYRSGAINWLARHAVRLGGRSEVRQLLVIMLTVGPISAFINNTAAVAILIPFVVRLARDCQRPPSKLLIPLSYTSQLAGVITLVGTSTNILTSAVIQEQGLAPLGMFEFSVLGLIVFLTGTAYLLLLGRRLLPERHFEAEATERFHLKPYLAEVVVQEGSPLVGQTLEASQLSRKFDIDVLEIIRDGEHLAPPLAERVIRAGDILFIRTDTRQLLKIHQEEGLALQPDVSLGDAELRGEDMALTEAIISPSSRLIGATLSELDFRNRYHANVLAISKHGELIRKRLSQVRLGLGDALLLQGPRRALEALKADRGFIVTEEIGEEAYRTEKIPIALAITAGVVLLAAFRVQPLLVAAIEGAALMVFTGCLRVRELHQAVRWDVIFLLAGVIPLGIAMEKTGAAQMIAEFAARSADFLPPLLLLGLFYLIAMLLTELISNNATVVLMIPIAVGTAQVLGFNPKAFILAIMFAASTSFSTPVGYQTNTMVFGPGGYKFFDYTRVGGPLNLLLWAVTTLALYALWGLD